MGKRSKKKTYGGSFKLEKNEYPTDSRKDDLLLEKERRAMFLPELLPLVEDKTQYRNNVSRTRNVSADTGPL